MQPDRLLKVRDAAKTYACSPDTIRKLIRAGDLPAVHVGASLRIRESDLEAYATPAAADAPVSAPAGPDLTAWRAQVDRDLAELRRQLDELRRATAR